MLKSLAKVPSVRSGSREYGVCTPRVLLEAGVAEFEDSSDEIGTGAREINELVSMGLVGRMQIQRARGMRDIVESNRGNEHLRK